MPLRPDTVKHAATRSQPSEGSRSNSPDAEPVPAYVGRCPYAQRVSYPYEDLDDQQFERLVIQVARQLFGAGVQGFAVGPDGGRDARFSGTAARFPSEAAGWSGVTVFQAKHTNGTNTHFSDPEFSGDAASSVISEELERIQRLASGGELQYYFLVANRRLGAVASEQISRRIAKATKLPRESIFLAGVEYLDEMLHLYPEVIGRAKIDPIDGPLLVSSYELAEVVLEMAESLRAPTSHTPASVVERTSYVEKNKLNAMSPEFAADIRRRYLPVSRQIELFLEDPQNASVVERYDDAVAEFQERIIEKRTDFRSFDALFNDLASNLIKRDGVLARNKRTVRALLFYMYWHCDIGRSAHADTD